LRPKKEDRYAQARQGGLLSTIPFLMVVPPVVGLLIGRYLDNRFNTNPVFTIVLLVAGFAASVREIANVLRKVNETDDTGDDDRGNRANPS